MKQCTICKQEKPLEAFCKSSGTLDGRHHYCKECRQAYYQRNRERFASGARDYRAVHPNKQRDANRKAKYGLTPEGFTQLLMAQASGCAICQVSLIENVPHPTFLHIDHCHTTGAVRGLLCEHCNRGIGMFKESSSLLFAAVEYLHQFHPDIDLSRPVRKDERFAPNAATQAHEKASE